MPPALSSFPKISIITVVYNNVDEIEGTIKSIIQQDYPHIEYLVIDGQSNDGTLDIIDKYKSQIDVFLSEPDKGLYDAMNKGLDLATGDFVWFMNSGDHIFERDTVSKMVAQVQEDTDIIFGEVLFVDQSRKHLGTRSQLSTQKLPKTLDYNSLKKGMVVCHQAFLPRRVIAPKYINNNLSADIEWVLQCLKHSKKNTASGLILAEFLVGGISKQQHRASLWGRFKILSQHYGIIPNLWNHFLIFIRAITQKTKY